MTWCGVVSGNAARGAVTWCAACTGGEAKVVLGDKKSEGLMPPLPSVMSDNAGEAIASIGENWVSDRVMVKVRVRADKAGKAGRLHLILVS